MQLVSGEIQCSCVRIGSMPTLGELPEKERKELARSLAKEIWTGVEHHGELPVSLEQGVFKLLEKSGLLHESNFHTDLNEEAQVAKLKEFHAVRDKACDYAERYDALVAPLETDVPGFARKGEELRRTFLTAHIARELCKPDSPFATLRTADAIDDQDRSDESNDDNDDDDDDDDDYDEGDESKESEESEETEESDSDSDCEANKVLDKADEKEASDNGSASESEGEDPPPKRKKSERVAAPPPPPNPARSGDDSDLSDA